MQNKNIRSENLNLEKDGMFIIQNAFSKKEFKNLLENCHKDQYKTAKYSIINNKNLNKIILSQTGPNYVFHDYIFIIKKSSIHTCHRDSNGDFFNDIKHPSYTLIIYLEDMEKCLCVIPSSHKNINSYGINLTNKTKNVLCKKGDILLFNANLIHSGTLNIDNENHLRIQMKVSHKNDIKKLSYYSNYNKILEQENTNPFFIKKIQQNTSCMFPIVSNYFQDSIKQSKYIQTEDDLSWYEKIYSYIFYGNKNFYKLPNVT